MPMSSFTPVRIICFAGFASWSLVFALVLSGCEKPSSSPTPISSATPVKEESTPPLPPVSEWDQEQQDAPVAKPAHDGGGIPATFAEGSSQEFRAAFEILNGFVRKHGGRLSVAAVDLTTDSWLVRSGERESVNPASNAKILTAAAALELLGSDYKFVTSLYGDQDDKGHISTLVIEGGGAPDLETSDLYRLIRVARGQGMLSVGSIVVDQSRFTDQFVPPAFEQQPDEWAPFRAPVSALALNKNSVSLNVVPKAAGEPALIWYDPPSVVRSQGTVMTSAADKGDRVTWALHPETDTGVLVSQVGGSLAAASGRHRYARRLHDPRLSPGLALRALLEESGVKISGDVRLGKRKKEQSIAVWSSAPLAELVRDLGKDSDNFVAEMLLIGLSGAEGSGAGAKASANEPWSSERGSEVLLSWLKKLGFSLEGVVMKNGSGLFDADRVTTELLAKVLAHVENNPRIYQEFVSQLATGATDGTLSRRMRQDPLAGRVRAKTGTIRDVDALSGYIQREGGRPPVAFSVVVTGTKTSHSAIRDQIDKMILAWAHALPEA